MPEVLIVFSDYLTANGICHIVCVVQGGEELIELFAAEADTVVVQAETDEIAVC